MGVNYEIDRIENSIKCLRGQVELLKDQCINVVIILETVEMLEKELYQLKDKLEKENKYYRVKSKGRGIKMTLEQQTKLFIENHIKDYYYKALEHGAVLSDIEETGANTYKCTLGNMIMLFIGTAEGTARMVACEGDVF